MVLIEGMWLCHCLVVVRHTDDIMCEIKHIPVYNVYIFCHDINLKNNIILTFKV